MQATGYEEALFGRAANENARPPRPNVINLAKKAIGRDNFSTEVNGCYAVWENGRWLRHLAFDEFIRAANRRLKLQGKPQISVNPAWLQ